jgi:hypothetical protein
LISIDIEHTKNHLSTLQTEIRETEVLIEMLTTICQNVESPGPYIKLLNRIQKEKDSILRRVVLIETMGERFQKTKTNVGEDLKNSIRLLNYIDNS